MVTIIAKKFQLGVWQVPKYAFLNKTVFQQSDCFFQIFCVKCVDKVSSGKNVLTLIRLGRGGARNAPPYALLYNLLVSSKFHDPKIFVGLIFWISFFQNSYWFLQCQHFSFFFCMSSVGKMNISLTILFVFESRMFRKRLYHLLQIQILRGETKKGKG